MDRMIHNVLGNAVTESTVLSHPNFKYKSEVSRKDLANVALALKSSQRKGQDEDQEVLRYVESLRDQYSQTTANTTLGWIYNASGIPITLVDSHDWEGGLASPSLYPVRIENGQWGLFLFDNGSFESSGGAVLYEGLYTYDRTCYWCVAWKLTPPKAQVYGKIMDVSDWNNQNRTNNWNDVYKSFESVGSAHAVKQGGLHSVISTCPSPHVVLEALLTLQRL